MRKDNAPIPTESRELGRDEINVKYPGLLQVREDVRRVVSNHFKGFQIHPPLIISEKSRLEETLSQTLSEDQLKITEMPFIAYELGSGVIETSHEFLTRRLSSAHGIIQLKDALLEEYVHAATAKVDKNGARCGFVMYPQIRYQQKFYKPSKVYESTPTKTAKLPIRADQQEGSIFLTENVTRFLVNQLLPSVCPEIKDMYGVAVVQDIHNKGSILWMRKKDPGLVRDVADALKTGQRRKLEILDDRGSNLREALEQQLDPMWDITNYDTSTTQMLNMYLFPDFNPSI